MKKIVSLGIVCFALTTLLALGKEKIKKMDLLNSKKQEESISIKKNQEVSFKQKQIDKLLLSYGTLSSLEMIEKMLTLGANVNAQDQVGNTPLMMAIEHHAKDSLKFVKLLLDRGAGADINKKNINGETALTLAMRGSYGYMNEPNRKKLELIKFLIEKGADPFIVLPDKRTLLHNCLDIEILKYLISCGLDVNALTKGGETPLHYNYHNFEKIKLLVEAGADVSLGKTYSGETLLHVVMFNPEDKAKTIQFLLQHGANPNIQNDNGDYPIHTFLNSSNTSVTLNEYSEIKTIVELLLKVTRFEQK